MGLAYVVVPYLWLHQIELFSLYCSLPQACKHSPVCNLKSLQWFILGQVSSLVADILQSKNFLYNSSQFGYGVLSIPLKCQEKGYQQSSCCQINHFTVLIFYVLYLQALVTGNHNLFLKILYRFGYCDTTLFQIIFFLAK